MAGGGLFVPEALQKNGASRPLLIFFHGGAWIPEVAGAQHGCMTLSFQTSAKAAWSYTSYFKEKGRFARLLAEVEAASGGSLGKITVCGWSAGCQAVRELLRDPEAVARVDRVLFIDGIHTSYLNGKPGPLESEIDAANLAPILAFANEAAEGRKRMMVIHGEIFPGTFASTTETADWLLRELKIPREATLEWGPMKTQQLSRAEKGGFRLLGFAGNAAPDHVDLLHALPDWLGTE